MRWRAVLGVAAGIVATAVGCDRLDEVRGEGAPRRINVVLVTFDALRADALSYAGSPLATSPRLDELATESAVFTQTISSFIGTTPSMPSLMTGR